MPIKDDTFLKAMKRFNERVDRSSFWVLGALSSGVMALLIVSLVNAFWNVILWR